MGLEPDGEADSEVVELVAIFRMATVGNGNNLNQILAATLSCC